MRRPLLALATLFTLMLPAAAQEPGVGFIRFVNAIALEGNLEIKMDGSAVRPNGYPVGDMTGAVGLTEGSHDFAFLHPACTGLDAPVKIEKGVTRTMVFVYEEKKDKEGEVKERVMKAMTIPPVVPDRRSSVTLYSFSRQPLLGLRAFLNNSNTPKDVVIKSGESTTIPMSSSGSLLLGLGQIPLLSMTIEDPGHFAAVIIDDPAQPGSLRVVYFLNETFQVGG